MAYQNGSFPSDPTGAAAGASHSPSAGELVSRVAEQLATLVRDELRLGQALPFGGLGAATLVAAAIGSPLPQEDVAGMRRNLDTLEKSAKR